MLKKKGAKITIGLIGGLLIGIITVVAALFIWAMLFFFGGPPEVIKNVDEYEVTMYKYTSASGHSNPVRTGFFIFPETIPSSAFEQDEKPDFYYSYQDTWDDPTCEVYLKCRYSDDDYKAEIDRIKKEYKFNKKVFLDDSKRFDYPTYLAINHHDFSYEYAMDLGNNSIVYIYTAFKSSLKSLKKIPEEYLPDDFEESLTLEKSLYGTDDSYDIYQLNKSVARSYTRNTN